MLLQRNRGGKRALFQLNLRRGRYPAGGIIMGLLGWLIVGAFIGGWVFNFFGHAGVTGINLGSIVVAFIGAVILLYIIRAFSGRRSVV
ncbi:MAG: GlsB/YeaQ/YmgE family stress response membrane protein [Candidatus Lustribacter sp.]|jgi:uncharacterized membrane protein YeaQ/YmgE (transglycosylase-associated protein family)